jgi:electron transfer flavoprotein alpha subunit
MASTVLVFVEVKQGKLKKGSLEVLSNAKKFADALGGGDVAAVLVGGADVKGHAAELGQYGANKVLVAAADWLNNWNGEAVSRIVTDAAKAEGAKLVFFAATLDGKDCAPRVAAALDAGLAADVTGLEANGGKLVATRPVYAGKTYLKLSLTTPVQVISVRPNTFMLEAGAGSAAVSDLAIGFGEGDLKSKVVSVEGSSGEKPDLTEAERIVSGGRGLKGPEHFKLLEDFADQIGATVGASRAVVDAGWRSHGDQVGQTGKTVSPNLYFAVGISGAIQHLAGMSTSKCIVAINKDKEAPIFKVADYGIVGDLFEVMPALTAEVKKIKG